MSTAAAGPVTLALLAAGTALIVASCLAALRARYAFTRLHFLSPVSSLGAPLIGLAIAIQNGWGLVSVEVMFIVVVLGVTGPPLESATGRLAGQREGLVPHASPR